MSDSNSQQQQTSNFTDNRTVLGEGSTYASGGSNVTQISVSNSLDGGAIEAAGNFADGVVAATTNLASDSLGLAGQVVDANTHVTSQAFNFGSDALSGALSTVKDTVTQALNFGSDALSGALASSDASLTKAFNFGSDSLGFAGSAFNKVVDYTTHTTDQALQNLQYTQQLTADAYADAKGRGALTDKILIGAVIAMAVVAAIAVKKG